MEHVSRIAPFYPTSPPQHSIEGLTEREKLELQNEFKNSKYQHPGIYEFLNRCDSKLVLSYPNVATLHVVFPEKEPMFLPIIMRALKRVACLLHKYGCKKHLVFWLIPTRLPRFFPSAGKMVQQEHINGGYTYPRENTVYIYRMEDFAKVMLHETIHHLPMDTAANWNPDDMMRLYDALKIDKAGCETVCRTNIAPNEAIVEAWANIYQLVFLAYEYGMDFNMLLRQECTWAMMQTKRIWTHQQKHFPLWRETTHAYSYMVLRAAILWNLKEFLKLETPYDTSLLTRFMLTAVKDPNFIEAVHRTKTPAHNSFRMTLFGNL